MVVEGKIGWWRLLAVYLGLALTFITAGVLGLGLMQLSKDRVTGLAAAALVLVLLCVSDSWRAFQTSGLEGSLSTLLVVLFVLALSQEEMRAPVLFFVAALLVVCRPDFALITALTPKKKQDADQPSKSWDDYVVPTALPVELRTKVGSVRDLMDLS